MKKNVWVEYLLFEPFQQITVKPGSTANPARESSQTSIHHQAQCHQPTPSCLQALPPATHSTVRTGGQLPHSGAGLTFLLLIVCTQWRKPREKSFSIMLNPHKVFTDTHTLVHLMYTVTQPQQFALQSTLGTRVIETNV